jgi:hypothetical protein
LLIFTAISIHASLALGIDDAEESCRSRMTSILDWGLDGESFEPSDSVLAPLPEPMSVLRDLYASQTVCYIASPAKSLVTLAAEAINCEFLLESPIAIQLNLTRWRQLEKYMKALCTAIGDRKNAPNPSDIVVVGSGPIGLFHALEAASFSPRVTIVERRWHFTRNMWFDLGPSTWYDTLEHIDDLGFNYLEFEKVEHQNGEEALEERIITLRCQVLQRILAKAAWIVGIDFLFGSSFESYEAPSEPGKQTMAVLKMGNDEIRRLKFDMLFAADGASSLARSSIHLSYGTFENFLIDSRVPMRIRGLAQPTLLINLKPNDDGQCPPLKKSSEGLVRDSYETGMVIPGITHVFKRFYHGRCHLQVLFTQEKMKEITDRSSVPWSLLMELTTFLFETPYESIEDLQSNVIQREASGAQEIDFEFFDIEIRKTGYAVYRPLIWETTSVISVIGDASITAHYRMGVGINNGVRQLETTRKLLAMAPVSQNNDQLEVLNYEEMQELLQLARFEAYLIAAESYCDFVVGLESSKSRYIYNTWLRNRSKYSLPGQDHLLKIEGMEIISSCPVL